MLHRYIMAGRSLAFDGAACVGCLRCVEVCPHGVYAPVGAAPVGAAPVGAAVSIIGREYCMECGACARNCPTGAIRVESGVGCATAVIGGILRGRAPACGCGSETCCGSGSE